uniref:Eukaryotic translation initiation factor 3 subunit A n=1 Tax=Setaria digitata TaxID=48799 RepID=A0A915Q053_9BILA
MPPNFFQKPETALKRAHELISVGKEMDALETLHDTIKSKRHKQWTKTHEAIMLKHMELCVSLRRPHMAKDALFQYKTLTQQVAIKSLETVIQRFLELAQQKTEEAQKTSIEKVEEIDDLDQADAPENLLLSAVSGDAAQDRMDRTVLSPWLRFLWDSYRNCLDLLRNTAVVEQLYHRIARQSFDFCAKYQRRTEFRKLCDNLRLHLTQIQKHQHLAHVVKLTSAESLTLMQDTRLIQLDTAIQMELWQEAYRSAEDVHGMMQLSKDKDERMLALVFWKAGNRLFHAAALLQKYIIYKDMKKTFSMEEAMDQATRVLLATLSIPDGADNPSDLTRHLDIEEQHIANMRLLSNLLRLPVAPTRAGILKEITRLSIPDVAVESARTLHRLLECNFTPLRLASEIQAELTKVTELNKAEYNQYVEALKGVTATKIIKQISVIYDTLSIKRIQKVIPFYSGDELERFLVDIAKHRYVKARIDHRGGSIHFGAADAALSGFFDLEASDGFGSEAEQVAVEDIRSHLQSMYNSLRDVVQVLDYEEIKRNATEDLKRHAEIYSYHKDADYERILLRRKKIESYKETSERQKLEKCQQAQAEANRKEEQRRAEEMRRLEQENIEKEKLRKLAEQEEIDRKVRAEKMKKIQSTPIYQAIVKDHGEEAFQNMDPDSVLREQRDRLDEQRREQQARLQQQEKKFDHLIRAYHLQEMVARKAISDSFAVKAPQNHDAYEKRRVESATKEHENAIAVYERMQKVRRDPDAAAFLESVKKARAEDFNKKMQEWERKLEDEKQKRLEERHELRKKERRREWLQERERELANAREAAEQARREEQEKERRTAREAQRPPKREVVENSDMDSDWRKSAQPTQPRTVPSKSFGERFVEGDRHRESGAITASEVDSGPWVRGNVVTGSQRQTDGPIRNFERPPMPSRFPEKEQSRSEADTAASWRKGQIVVHRDRDRDQAVGQSLMEKRGEPPGAQTHDAKAAATSSPADAGPWRRGMVVTRPGDQSDSSQRASATAPTSQPWRPSRFRQADGAAVNGAVSGRILEGSGSNESNTGKWNRSMQRTGDGHGAQSFRALPQNQQRRGAADDDRNWRQK